MSDVKTKGNLKFIKHRPIDKTDPGFRIVGWKLRWIAMGTTESKDGRIWRVLRKSEIPAEILTAMTVNNPDIFGQDSTIRNRELVLAYAPEEIAAAQRKEAEDIARGQMAQINRKSAPGGGRHISVDEAEVSHVSGAEFFDK
jgi:hypothetical protein